tara:strand:+ start:115 stop:690 length:576 start_codon:yes stop_codon:yes gene_type:complete
MFRYPSKFLNKGDKRLGKPLMRPKIIVKNDEIEYILDKDGEKIMENVCNFYPKDDAIKEWAKSDKVLDAFIEILFTHYGERTDVPESMKEEMEDFKEEENEEDKFLSLFNFPGDLGWEDNQQDYISISQITSALRKAHINLSPQKYKNYLTPRGAVKLKRSIDNKKVFCWFNVQINKDNVQELTEELTSDD